MDDRQECEETGSTAQSVRAGLRISAVSVAWTLVSGATAVVIGIYEASTVLGAFGLIGLVDAVGSVALVVHFRHALRHEAISVRREELTSRIVTIGMACVGIATIAVSTARLVGRDVGHSSIAPVVLAATCFFVLVVLASRKRNIAHRIPSHALAGDAMLSTVGAALAFITVAGTVIKEALGWWWIDPLAAAIIGATAIAWCGTRLWGQRPSGGAVEPASQ